MSGVEMNFGPPPSPMQVQKIVTEEATASIRTAVLLSHGEVLARMERSRRTGTAMRSVYHRVQGVGGVILGFIGSGLNYVRWGEEGTGLYGPLNHWITPKNSRFLVFPQPGNSSFTLAGRQRSGRAGAGASWVFARRVRGMRPRRWFYDAALVTEPKVERVFQAGGDRIMTRIAALWRVQ